jgi:NADH-quinone oxidoreductase subunit H
MTTSISAVPPPSTHSTGAFNQIEIFKFLRLVVIWMCLIFGPVWLACWAVGSLIPDLVHMAMGGGTPNAVVVYTTEICRALVPLVAVMVFIPINAMFMVLCERRALALFTVRKGPNRVGPDGLAQTAADAVKLLFKEDITPNGADSVMFTLAPIIFFAPSIFGAMPLLAAVTYNHPFFRTMELPTGIFFVLAASSIPVVALVMGGWASNNKYSLVGGLRSAAQAVSYEIPLVLSLITMCFLYGTLNVSQIGLVQTIAPLATPDATNTAAAQFLSIQDAKPTDVFYSQGSTAPLAPQSAGLLYWGVFGNGVLLRMFDATTPWQIFAALGIVAVCITLLGIYLTSACAEISRIPFDLPEAESELVSGYNTEYSGIKFAIFFLAEFTNLFIVATIATVMFLGAGSSPIPGFLDASFFQKYIFHPIGGALGAGGGGDSGILYFLGSLLNPVTLSGWLWVTIKVYSIVLLAILVRGTLPRFRIDQLMDFGWKRLIPLSLILFVAAAFLKEML